MLMIYIGCQSVFGVVVETPCLITISVFFVLFVFSVFSVSSVVSFSE